LPHTPQLGHLAEDQLNGLLRAMIRILFGFAIRTPTETDGKEMLQFAAASLSANCLRRPLPKQVQLELAHRAL
jgi:hypothetical protein